MVSGNGSGGANATTAAKGLQRRVGGRQERPCCQDGEGSERNRGTGGGGTPTDGRGLDMVGTGRGEAGIKEG